jgi:membrane protease YdiL (CAAX protease family)
MAGVIPISDQLSLMFGQTRLGTRLAFAALVVLLAPIAEELLYRGVIQGSVRARSNVVLACLVQAALFAVMHQKSLAFMLTILAGGAAFGALALWRGSLQAPIVAHAAYNAVVAGWLVALFWLNAHVPAANMEEAKSRPDWWLAAPERATPGKNSAAEEYELAVWRFGSPGLQLWKVEAQALDDVRQRFPEDRYYAARSLAGVQEIYLRYLNDPRRAIAAGQELMRSYPDQRDLCERAMVSNARALLTSRHAKSLSPRRPVKMPFAPRRQIPEKSLRERARHPTSTGRRPDDHLWTKNLEK